MTQFIFITFFLLISFTFNTAFSAGKTNLKIAKIENKKNALGFWMNDEESALKEATKLKKPILIDFYGIWCPPCNQLDELVFPTAQFKTAAKKFVLLKMDADSEKSWLLKSKYNVGGYPTLILAKVEENQPTTEIGRIVGYSPTEMITTKMSEALYSDGKSNHDRLVDLINKSILQSEDLDDKKSELQYINAGLSLEPENLNFKLGKLKIESADHPDVLKATESKKILEGVVTDRKKMSVNTLLSQYEINPTKDVLDELLSRVNPETLFIDNNENSEADIYALGIDLAEKEKNKQAEKIYTEMTVQSYEKLLKKYGDDSRSLNLSYTHYLQKADENKKAESVYAKMNAKYPKEFTFYYQAALMYLDLKDFIQAKNNIHSAIENSYGDNKLRSYDRALKIAVASTDKAEIKLTIDGVESFLKDFKKPAEGVNVRTDRYLKKLTASLDEAKKSL